ncbi:MAG TPA: methyltransferase domain-containing protein [Anaeromyxobacteraceae bacterium]|nr:methyltransferase domain-containing protein [Anaeromyxobacteraceae bacterium]
MLRVNVGCGGTPTPGWINFDNSLSVLIASAPGASWLTALLRRTRGDFVRKAKTNGIRWASATKLPLADASAEVVYTSHMLEHMEKIAARRFLAEARRVLAPRGVLRVVVPDLQRKVATYVEQGDADLFLESTLLSSDVPCTLAQRVRFVALGTRGHVWMYDARSLIRLLKLAGFVEIAAVAPGETRIENPGPLDLAERAEESIYVEASKP